MSVQSLGQFLIQRGAIDSAQLREALAWLDHRSVPLGALAVERGWLTEAQVAALDAEAARVGGAFVELLAESGWLDAPTLDALLQAHADARLGLGEALIQLGHLERGSLPALLAAHEEERGAYRLSGVPLPPELAADRVVSALVGLFPGLVQRTCGLELGLTVDAPAPDPERFPYCASVVVRGARPWRIELAASDGLAVALTCARLGDDEATGSPAVLVESLGELLNVVAGNVVALLEVAGTHLSLLPPERGVGYRRGTALGVVTPRGEGVLYLEPEPRLPVSSLELP